MAVTAFAHPVIECMPAIESDEINEIFADPWTLFYDDDTMPMAMQFGPNLSPARVYDGRHIFNPYDRTSNGNIEFPWKIGGGMHLTGKDLIVIKFYWHQGHKPVRRYRTRRIKELYGMQSVTDWKFPLDAVVGEVILLKRNGYTYPIEIRTFTREPDAWQPRVYRQFNSPEDVADKLWELGYRDLAHRIGNLIVKSEVLYDRTHSKPAVVIDYSEATLPSLPERAVDQLLNAPLKEVVVPSTLTSLVSQLMPANYHPAMIGSLREDCAKCHKHVGMSVTGLDYPGRDWYGRFRGGDNIKGKGGIFSFNHWTNPRLESMGYTAPYNGEAGYL